MRNIRRCALFALVTVVIVIPSSAFADGLFFEGRGGGGGFSGDVGDTFSTGIIFGGSGGFELEGNIAIEGDISFLLMDAVGGAPELVYNNAGFLSFLGGVRFFLMPPESPARLFFGGGGGFSILAWDYTRTGESFTGVDSDGIGALSAFGKIGVQVLVSDSVGLSGEGRLILNAWSDETTEGFDLDTDGASFQVTGGVTLFI
jgi:hypothetical protein